MGHVGPSETSETCSINTDMEVEQAGPEPDPRFPKASKILLSVMNPDLSQNMASEPRNTGEVWIQETEPVLSGGPAGPQMKDVNDGEHETGRQEGLRTFRRQEVRAPPSADPTAMLVLAAVSTTPTNQTGSSPAGFCLRSEPSRETRTKTETKPQSFSLLLVLKTRSGS